MLKLKINFSHWIFFILTQRFIQLYFINNYIIIIKKIKKIYVLYIFHDIQINLITFFGYEYYLRYTFLIVTDNKIDETKRNVLK